jgi:hypothetical protein
MSDTRNSRTESRKNAEAHDKSAKFTRVSDDGRVVEANWLTDIGGNAADWAAQKFTGIARKDILPEIDGDVAGWNPGLAGQPISPEMAALQRVYQTPGARPIQRKLAPQLKGDPSDPINYTGGFQALQSELTSGSKLLVLMRRLDPTNRQNIQTVLSTNVPVAKWSGGAWLPATVKYSDLLSLSPAWGSSACQYKVNPAASAEFTSAVGSVTDKVAALAARDARLQGILHAFKATAAVLMGTEAAISGGVALNAMGHIPGPDGSQLNTALSPSGPFDPNAPPVQGQTPAQAFGGVIGQPAPAAPAATTAPAAPASDSPYQYGPDGSIQGFGYSMGPSGPSPSTAVNYLGSSVRKPVRVAQAAQPLSVLDALHTLSPAPDVNQVIMEAASVYAGAGGDGNPRAAQTLAAFLQHVSQSSQSFLEHYQQIASSAAQPQAPPPGQAPQQGAPPMTPQNQGAY